MQEAYNKFRKIVVKDAMNVDLGLQKIASLKLDKKNLLLKLFDANELLDKEKTENMLLLDKVKNLELELSVAREQTNRFTSSKLEHMLNIQKSPLDKIGLGFKDSISVPKTRVDLKESKPKTLNPPKDKLHDRPMWVCHFSEKSRHIRPNCFNLQVAKRANKSKVLVPQAQDPMVLIGESVKALNLYSNLGVAHHANMNNNSNGRVASKKFWMQNA